MEKRFPQCLHIKTRPSLFTRFVFVVSRCSLWELFRIGVLLGPIRRSPDKDSCNKLEQFQSSACEIVLGRFLLLPHLLISAPLSPKMHLFSPTVPKLSLRFILQNGVKIRQKKLGAGYVIPCAVQHMQSSSGFNFVPASLNNSYWKRHSRKNKGKKDLRNLCMC